MLVEERIGKNNYYYGNSDNCQCIQPKNNVQNKGIQGQSKMET